MAVTEDGLLGGRVTLMQPRRGYRVAIDAVLLAAAVEARPTDRILDLGAGVGAVGLCLATRVPGCRIVSIEIQPALAALAERGAGRNGLADRVTTIVHDIALPLPSDLGLFDHVATNPPYLAAAVADPSPDRSKALATVESSADLRRWLAVATAAAAADGTVTIIHRADRLEEIAGLLERLGWGDLVVKPLAPSPRVLVRARRSRAAHRRTDKALVLHRPDGAYTEEAEDILRHAGPLAIQG